MKICITADSTCDIPSAQVKSGDIRIVPLRIVLGERALLDGKEITPDDIFRYVSEGNPIPKTAAVNVEEYRETFRQCLNEYDAVVHINIGSGFSSCCSNAMLAAEGMPVYCVDSANLCFGSGVLALEALRLRETDASAAEIAAALREMAQGVSMKFILNSLDYMRKGGRCSSVAALGANLLKMRPAIEVREGQMIVGKKYRGSYERCAKQFVSDHIAELRDSRYVILGHTGVDAALMGELADMLRAEVGDSRLYTMRVGCSITTHCGENTIGLCWV